MRTCPECGGEMRGGFSAVSLDGTTTPLFWVEGYLERLPLTKGASIEGKERVPIKTCRRDSCGLLQTYARG